MRMSEREARDMIEEIKQRGKHLSGWEINFLDRVRREERNLSYGELEKVSQIYEFRVK